jgi:peroxiredoxin
MLLPVSIKYLFTGKKVCSMIFFLLFFVFDSTAQHQVSGNYRIELLITHWKNLSVSLVVEGDTVYRTVTDGRPLIVTGKTDRLKEAVINMRSGNLLMKQPIYIEPGTIYIKDIGNGITKFETGGTYHNDTLTALLKRTDTLFKRTLFPADNYEVCERNKRIYIRNQIAANPNSILVNHLFKTFFLYPDISDDERMEAGALIGNEVRASFYGREITDEMLLLMMAPVGKPAPSFTLQNRTGADISLNDFKGKYVLLDFWASWCGPCREKIPFLKEMYERYHQKGLEVITISLDTDRAAWLLAMAEDNFSGINLNESKGWESSIAKDYGIRAIPAAFLINREGIIIGRKMEMDDLASRLKEIFSQ